MARILVAAGSFDVMELLNKFVNIDSLYTFAWVVFGLCGLIFGVMFVAGSFASALAKKLRIAYFLGGIMLIALIPIILDLVKPAFKAVGQ
ncbi:hypothetical protein [Herpetosiphon giganteus]|uniref:hypothetical protein n=1 Tax=Herpetosiphon giganteus TaxID=2029754 RepID=UPI0019590A6D|nr:hypothetical protein [Herpetosiphon giganteus]MBM7845637.1 magnesium-transporting ATPase (P-type) [Herpetosiphon giganteus]